MKFLLCFLALLFGLTLFRLTDMLFFYPSGYSDWISNSLLMGARFDALILSFVLILSLVSYWKKQYLFNVLWGFVASLNFINSLGFKERLEHLWLQDFNQWELIWSSGSWLYKLISLLVSVFVFYWGIRIFKFMVAEYQNSHLKFKVFYFLLLLIFARGSLANDHLRRNHCDGRPHKTIRSFCMNPVYTFLKPRNLEFP